MLSEPISKGFSKETDSLEIGSEEHCPGDRQHTCCRVPTDNRLILSYHPGSHMNTILLPNRHYRGLTAEPAPTACTNTLHQHSAPTGTANRHSQQPAPTAGTNRHSQQSAPTAQPTGTAIRRRHVGSKTSVPLLLHISIATPQSKLPIPWHRQVRLFPTASLPGQSCRMWASEPRQHDVASTAQRWAKARR